jgi:N-methylhydantoinase A
MGFSRAADMRFVGQGYEVAVAIPNGPLGEAQRASIVAAFRDAYRDRYKHLRSDGGDIEFVRLWVRAWTPAAPIELVGAHAREGACTAASTRDAYFADAGGYVTTPVYRWAQLPAETPIHGPAIIEAVDTTVVVGPGAVAAIGDDRYLTMTVRGG